MNKWIISLLLVIVFVAAFVIYQEFRIYNLGDELDLQHEDVLTITISYLDRDGQYYTSSLESEQFKDFIKMIENIEMQQISFSAAFPYYISIGTKLKRTSISYKDGELHLDGKHYQIIRTDPLNSYINDLDDWTIAND